jgi:rod shape-determining protein MreC
MRLFFVYLVLSISFLYLNLTPVPRQVRGVVSFALNPVSFLFLQAGSEISNYTLTINQVRAIARENTELKQNLQKTQAVLITYLDDKNQTEFLKKHQDFLNQKGTVISAEVVARTEKSNYLTISINKGSESGVEQGDSVFNNGYLIGFVEASFPNKSVVNVVSAAGLEVPAISANSESPGVYYCSNNECFFDRVLTADTLNVGDIVTTSGVNGNYTSGLILGEITYIESSPEKLFKKG